MTCCVLSHSFAVAGAVFSVDSLSFVCVLICRFLWFSEFLCTSYMCARAMLDTLKVLRPERFNFHRAPFLPPALAWLARRRRSDSKSCLLLSGVVCDFIFPMQVSTIRTILWCISTHSIAVAVAVRGNKSMELRYFLVPLRCGFLHQICYDTDSTLLYSGDTTAVLLYMHRVVLEVSPRFFVMLQSQIF